ncbi:MAG: glycoside hydrolase family 9 protein [Ruminococcus flavefaciens]|nr:glycoside hydrolase family 9 protein [Ruminococcus flavefaciens]
MKGFQSLIRKYLKDHEKRKKYLAVIMSLSTIVTFAVPMSLIMPAISMTDKNDTNGESPPVSLLANEEQGGGQMLNNAAGTDGNIVNGTTYSPSEMSLKTLLIGEGTGVAWADGCITVDEIMNAAMDEYFLGIANDFCAFIEGDFTATEADAEGRVAIGGDLTFTKDWNYQVGSGDYATMTHLSSTDNYAEIANFASVIVGGKMVRINTLSTGYGHDRNGTDDEKYDDANDSSHKYHTTNAGNKYSYTVYYLPEEGLFKRFIIGNIDDSHHITYVGSTSEDLPYSDLHSHDYPGGCGDNCPHNYLDNINELAQMYQYDDTKDIISKAFSQIRERSSILSQKKGIAADGSQWGDIHLTGPGTDSKAKTVYFDLGGSWKDYRNIFFDDIPEGANIVVNCGDSNVVIAGDGNNSNVHTFINGTEISNTGNVHSNNHPDSQRILYNFYAATKVSVNGNFNGTILAPNADVTSMEEKSPGHLSGALIAKSFKGGLEFGYRPYRGGADILGAVSGYTIPVDKFSSIKDDEGNSVFLPGATLALIDTNNTPDNEQDDSLVSAWNSGSETKYASIPTAVDFSGDTDYTSLMENGTYTILKTYILEEQSAPEGYLKEDKQYSIKVEETIYSDYLLPKDGSGTFPQKIDVKVQMTESPEKPDGLNETLEFTIKDAYGDKGIEQRRIYVKGYDGNTINSFAIDVTTASGKTTVDSVKNITETADNDPEESLISQPSPTISSDSTDKPEKPAITQNTSTRIAEYSLNNINFGQEYGIHDNVTGSVSKIEFDFNLKSSDESVGNPEITFVYYSDDNNTGNYDGYHAQTFTSTGSQTINLSDVKVGKIQINCYNNADQLEVSNLKITYNTPNTFNVTPQNEDLIVGDSTQLNIQNAKGDILWYYEPEQGCEITTNGSEYTLNATEPGWYTITGTDSDTDSLNTTGKVGTFTVYVNPFQISNVSDISENTATLTANKPAVWSISDETIAEITTSDSDQTKCIVKLKETTNTTDENKTGDITAKYIVNDKEYTTTAKITIPKANTQGKRVNKLNANGTNIVDNIQKSSLITIGDENNKENYYYSPESIMIMPLPKENLDFVNKPGLLFKKVDDAGNAVTGADIQLWHGETQITDETIWKWDSAPETGSDSFLIDVSKLTVGETYTFKENSSPSTYEKAEDIYFNVKDATHIEYWKDGDSEPYPILDLTQERIIEMVDNRVLGVKLTLRKVDSKDKSIKLEGAKFSLYSADGTLICSDLDGNGNIFDNEVFKNLDNNYTKNGYLFPGVYYLTEDIIPDHPEKDKGETYKNPGKIYFTVNSNYSITSGRPTSVSIDVKDVDGGRQYFVCVGENKDQQLNGKDGVSINNVKSFIVKADPEPLLYLNVDGNDLKVNGSEIRQADGSYQKTFDNPVSLTKFEIQNNHGWSYIDPSYVEIVTADGTKYIFAPNSSGGNSAMSDENPMLTVDGSTFEIGNEKEKDEKDITVTKKWLNDEGFESLRPDSITVKLYRSETELTDAKTQLTEAMAYKKDGSDVTAVLSESNNWTATWSGLESKYLKDGVKQPYYYYIKEVKVPDGYDDSYSVDPDGTLIAANTLKTISLNIEKIWYNPSNSNVAVPNSLTVKLQIKNDDNWVDVRNITLTSADDWKAVADNLPAGKTYRITEPNVPNGWKIKTDSNESSVDSSTLSITNEPKLSSLIIQKLWDDENSTTKRPDSIKVALYRSTNQSSSNTPGLQPSPTGALWPEQTADEVKEDYARLLQYSLFFYDGVMCGNQVDENSNYYWRGDCHTDDEVPGGFHDAGDHAMFGLPAGFSASNLGWNLYEFREDYDELGQTAHTKMITDYYAEFFSKCIRNNNGTTEILVQKGHGNTDHAYWGIPELQDSREDQMYWRSNAGADIAAEYAASLALSYLNFHTTDEAKYSAYLEKAKELYEFSERVNTPLNEWGVNKDETQMSSQYPGFYASDSEQDDQAWAAVWIAVASNEAGNSSDYNSYKQKASAKLSGLGNGWGGYHWNNVALGAKCANAAYLGGSWNDVTSFANSECTGSGYKDTNAWGQSRYNTGYQTIALAAANHSESGVNTDNVKSWCRSQMNYILGDCCGTALVSNFSENSTKRPHFRAGAGKRCDMEVKDDTNIIDGYDQDVFRLIGGLVGGPQYVGSSYADIRSDYQTNEVASDYNANLVGAAAGLYHFYKTGYTYEIPGVKNAYNGKPDPSLTISEATIQSISELPTMIFRYDTKLYAEGDNYIEFSDAHNSDVFNTMLIYDQNGNCADISSYISGKKVTKIELGHDSNKIALRMNNGVFHWNDDGNLNPIYKYEDGKLIFEPREENGTMVYPRIWGANSVPYNEISSFAFIWNKPKYVRFYFEAENSYTITADKSELLPGETAILTVTDADGNTVTDINNWTIPGGYGSITNNNDGTYTYTAGGHFGDVTLTGEANNIKGKITLTTKSITAVNSPIRLRINDTSQIQLSDNTGTITYRNENDSIASIDGNGNVTAKAVGETTFTIICNGVETDCTGQIIVVDQLIISGDNVMNIGDEIQLTASGNVGNVKWTSSDENVAAVDENGKVTSKNYGSVTITATDSDGSSAEFTINVQAIGKRPDIPENAELVDVYTIYGKQNWSLEVSGLPLTDENGRPYYYYIAECDSSGTTVTEIKGSGVKYLPSEYDNGKQLIDGESTQLSVKNTKGEETQGEMPSAGGEGTTIYYVTGIIISSIAAYYLIRRRRKSVAK